MKRISSTLTACGVLVWSAPAAGTDARRNAGLGMTAMTDKAGTKRRRSDAALRIVARYGEATSRGGKGTVEPLARRGGSINFSSPGLALIGLRRRNTRPQGPRSATG
jgi:hypothetical protein